MIMMTWSYESAATAAAPAAPGGRGFRVRVGLSLRAHRSPSRPPAAAGESPPQAGLRDSESGGLGLRVRVGPRPPPRRATVTLALTVKVDQAPGSAAAAGNGPSPAGLAMPRHAILRLGSAALPRPVPGGGTERRPIQPSLPG
jgi:hypothetical protein